MMIIKSNNQTNLFYIIKTYKTSWRSLLLVFVALATILIFTILGTYLQYSGKTRAIKGWVLGIYNNQLEFIPNYFKSLVTVPDHIDIDIKFEDYQKLSYKRYEALNYGSLISSPDDWVPATIQHNGELYKIDLRLKGDLPDHWQKDEMWSFKIKVKGDKTLFGMKRFAIQSPDTRNYLNEYVFHRLLEHSGLISLRYDFISVSINGRKQPIYALEENFDKLMIENNGLREGPIFQIEEGKGINRDRERLWGAVKPYQGNKMATNETLLSQFERAKTLFELFRQGRLESSKVFDLGKLAMLFAIVDLTGHHHATHLDNLKLYYNPVTSLIEPIGYDNQLILPLDQESLQGENMLVELSGLPIGEPRPGWYKALFNDIEFYENYIQALGKVSEKGYLDDFFRKIDVDLRHKTHILHKSYPWYNFKDAKSTLYNNQAYIKGKLNPSSELLRVHYRSFSSSDQSLSLQFLNLHTLPIQITGIAINDSEVIKSNSIILLQPALNPIVAQEHFILPEKTNFLIQELDEIKVHFKVIGSDKEQDEHIIPWPYIKDDLINHDMTIKSSSIKELDFVEKGIEENELYIKVGEWDIRQNVIIPKGYKILVFPGTTLNLLDSANILSYSTIHMSGTKENPIIITSSDSTGQGMLIINARDESVLENVHFTNLSSLSQQGWDLTGAVTFYQSSVRIENCQFANMRSEDALNVIRTDYSLKNTSFLNNFGDAIDGDYTSGNVSNTSFVNSGNDAIDISGSILHLDNVFINYAGDKAISAGEKSQVDGMDIFINNTELGINSKDLSICKLKNIGIENTKVGLLAFQKKAEYGEAKIIIDNYKTINVDIPYLVEEGSKLIIDGISTISDKKNVEDMLYGSHYGKSSK
tara:strand:+ start:1282 stop:3897 length:2616 start_codon:yes stop_codon:yes gene_type:complete